MTDFSESSDDRSNRQRGAEEAIEAQRLQLELQFEELLCTQRSLEEARRRYVRLFELAPVGYCVLTAEGRVLEINEQAKLLLEFDGRSPDSVPLILLLDSGCHATFRAVLSQLQKGKQASLEVELVSRSGRTLSSQGALLAQDGEPQILLSLTDITELEEARTRILESRDLLKQMMEVLPYRIGLFDDQLREWSWKDSSFRPRRRPHLFDWLGTPAQHRPLLSKEAAKILSGESTGFEYRYLDDQGRTYLVRMLGFSGPPVGLLVLLEDQSSEVAAREEADSVKAQLVQAQKMDALGRLAGGVAHDFNNLLTVIRGYAETLAEAVPDAGQAADLSEIVVATERASWLTRQLLAFSRSQPAETVTLDVTSELRTLERMLRRLLPENIEFEMRALPGLSGLKIDRGHFHQLLLNLVVNAREAISGDGRIEVQAAKNESAGTWTLTVTDDGCGMPPGLLGSIFEPFFTTKESGTGLGLSVVYGIAQEANGALKVESVEGQGTTFSLTFPSVEVPQQEVAPRHAAAGTGDGQLILVAEDELSILSLVDRVLTRAGYHTLCRTDGQALLEAATECGRVPSLLISDLVMPHMGGRELYERLRQLYPGLPVLFVSGYSPDELASDEPNSRVLTKPFSLKELVNLVHRILGDRDEELERGGSGRPGNSEPICYDV